MRRLGWSILAAAAFLLLAAPPETAAAQQSPEGVGVPLTLEAALEPDEAMLREAIQRAPVNAEEMVNLADQMPAVELVDVGSIAGDSAAVEQALQDAETDLALLRAALPSSEPVAAAMEQAGIAVDDVLAVQVIHGDVVSVVLYHAG